MNIDPGPAGLILTAVGLAGAGGWQLVKKLFGISSHVAVTNERVSGNDEKVVLAVALAKSQAAVDAERARREVESSTAVARLQAQAESSATLGEVRAVAAEMRAAAATMTRVGDAVDKLGAGHMTLAAKVDGHDTQLSEWRELSLRRGDALADHSARIHTLEGEVDGQRKRTHELAGKLTVLELKTERVSRPVGE